MHTYISPNQTKPKGDKQFSQSPERKRIKPNRLLPANSIYIYIIIHTHMCIYIYICNTYTHYIYIDIYMYIYIYIYT